MCGIVGYIGDRNVSSILLVGLERLSYRGYDSSGIAIMSNGEISCWKQPGKIHELTKSLEGFNLQGELGIGHTRWATHGEANEVNAHPHLGPKNKVAIVHNGIIENFAILKSELIEQGHIFRSETDTEVIAHLIESYLNGDLVKAVEKAVEKIEGSYALCVVSESHPGEIIVCRKGSPIIIGIGEDENFVSSDVSAIIPHTKDMIYLEDNQCARITKEAVQILSPEGDELEAKVQHVSWDPVAAEKNGYPHYMLKEIFEQPDVARKIMSKVITKDGKINFKKLNFSNEDLSKASRFIIQACGTSWHASLVAKHLLETYGRVLTDVDISSEFRYRSKVTDGNEIVMALSQSGETADTLACIREAKSKFFKVLSFVNAKNSSMDRESDGVIYSYAGQEVGVASTKNYIAQLITIYLFTIYLAQVKWTVKDDDAKQMIQELKMIPEKIQRILDQAESIEKVAEKYFSSKGFLFIGRGLNYPSALEGALKLKEISYIHATGYPAGELKHGPIALIDENMPIVCIAPQSDTYDKMVSNIQEVRARKGRVIVIATEGDTEIANYAEDVIYIPQAPEELTPILVAIPLQILAYHIAIKLDCDVDQPRNLAKSVTVE